MVWTQTPLSHSTALLRKIGSRERVNFTCTFHHSHWTSSESLASSTERPEQRKRGVTGRKHLEQWKETKMSDLLCSGTARLIEGPTALGSATTHNVPPTTGRKTSSGNEGEICLRPFSKRAKRERIPRGNQYLGNKYVVEDHITNCTGFIDPCWLSPHQLSQPIISNCGRFCSLRTIILRGNLPFRRAVIHSQ